MKLGSSRGMDTKRPRGSERSKPCHQLRLTRRSLPPYPWPPEQAQPGVSKPCRTTPRALQANEETPRAAVAKFAMHDAHFASESALAFAETDDHPSRVGGYYPNCAQP